MLCDGDEYTNLCLSASLPLCFLLFLFIYSSPSISFSFLHYTLIVIFSLQVRIKKKDSPYFGYKGIISGIIGEEAEEGSIQASTGNVAEADGGDGGSAEQKEPDNDSQKIVKVTYKVTITPKTPGGLKTFSRSGDPNDEFVALDLHQHEGKQSSYRIPTTV